MRRLGRDGGGGQAVPESFDPAELVQEAMTLLQREAGSAQVEMRLEREPDAPKIVAVKDHVHQVFLNLLLNAIHASPAGGKVRVRVFPDPAEEALCVEVTDSGPGIPKDHLDRIFDPFFTTKGPDQGTGLGLMICHRLVADHEGSIEVSSREGQGASFCVRLPLGSDLGSGPARPVA
jgi:signal transduction histidine kinase